MSCRQTPEPSNRDSENAARRATWPATLAALRATPAEVAILIVDHGSRVAASNDLLVEFARQFATVAPVAIIEPAHMDLAEPSIATAFDRCVARGAQLVLISPFFLLPGRHWNEDIPRLVQEAAARHTGVRWFLAAPLGLHPLLPEIMLQRIEQCARLSEDPQAGCDVCGDAPHRCGLGAPTH